jgi:bacteriocin biosynthesis cyclodehydratase domain-containing protein
VSESWHVISVGPFGRAVARHLRSSRAHLIETAGEGTQSPADWPRARALVVAAWRPIPDLCEAADAESHRRGTPFLPVIADSAALSIGPVIVPGRGNCWSCWVRRTHQHAPSLGRRAALWRHYSEHAGAGPHGYLEPFAVVAAARVRQILEAVESEAPVAGQVWAMHLLTRRIVTSTVVGVHGCPRCGLHRRESTRSYAELRQALSFAWSAGDGEGR